LTTNFDSGDWERFDGVPRMVHILSMSEPGCGQAARMAERAARRSGKNLSIDARVFDVWHSDHRLVQPMEGCAAIVVLSWAGTEDDQFTQAVNLALEESGFRDDFRIYIILDGITPAQFSESASLGWPLFEHLRENIQLTNGMTADEAGAPLSDYLSRLEDVQKRAAWLQIGTSIIDWTGRAALAIQLLCSLILLCAWLLVQFGWADRLSVGIGIRQEAASLSVGIFVFAVSMLPAYFSLRGFFAASDVMRQVNHLMPKLLLCFLITFAAFKMTNDVGPRDSWMILGLALGACVDAIRRAGFGARRLKRALEPRSVDIGVSNLKDNLREVGPVNIFRLPLWSNWSQSIVISYARASDWSNALAGELHSALRTVGIPVFLDLESIPVGSNWRRELQYEIGLTKTFICVLDQIAVTRPWVATELSNALQGLALTGSPQVIALENPELDLNRALPLFRQALIEGNESHQVRRVSVSSRTVGMLSQELTPAHFQTPSVVPQFIGLLIELIMFPITIVSGLTTPLGFFAWVAWVVEMWFSAPILRALHPVTATALFLFFAYMVGSGFKRSVLSQFRVRSDSPGALAIRHVLSAIGFLPLTVLWFHEFPPLIQAWALVAFALGWWRSGEFVISAATRDRSLLRF